MPFQQQTSAELQADIAAGYTRATKLPPLQKKDIKDVYSTYGVKKGIGKKGTNAQARKLATKSVLAWWKKDHPKGGDAKPAAAKTKPGVKTGKTTAGKMTVPKAPSESWVKTTLENNGITNATPPPYALASSIALEAWVRRVKRNSALRLRTRPMPTALSAPR